MGLRKEMFLIQQFLLIAAAVSSAIVPIAKRDCPDICGNLSIPFPFGTRDGCYLDDNFFINCTQDGTPFLRHGNLRVLDLSLNGTLRVSSSIARDCYDKQGSRPSPPAWFRLSKTYSLSYSLNKFISVGCDTIGSIRDPTGYRYFTGCVSYCYSNDYIVNGSCLGVGCCQVPIPKGARGVNISLSSYYNHSYVASYSPCSYAFVVEDGLYKFNSLDLVQLQTMKIFPVVIDWAIGNITCAEAKRNQTAYACKADHSNCTDSEQTGYLCNCFAGFHGNPYLSYGCPDVNECADPKLNECLEGSSCINTKGNYTCLCPEGYRGNGRRVGEGCLANNQRPLQLKIIVGVSVAISTLLVIILMGLLEIRRKQMMKLREKNFKKHGGLMLRQLLSKVERSEERAKIFTEDELNKATNNFNKNGIIGQGGYGTVYKGILKDKTTVAIKKSKVMDHDQVDQFVNEVIVLSQIRHPSVVKLLGCCLETPVPLLVYEFITNKTLYHHIHSKADGSSLGWKTRLNIAIQTADALAHMHSDAPLHIIHRDIKSANILLDDSFQAKVSDFGVSRLVPLDQTQLSTMVQGTLGYIDPEYFHSGILNDKSDVYSFGVVLAELLTGKRVICPNRPKKDKYLVAFFISSIKEDNLRAILDEQVKNEGHPDQLEGFANIARCCMKSKGEKRPTMKEVKEELERLISIQIHKSSNVEITADIEEAEPLLGPPATMCHNFIDSTQFQAPMELESGR